MRMILIIAIAIGGFYFVNNNLREHGQAPSRHTIGAPGITDCP